MSLVRNISIAMEWRGDLIAILFAVIGKIRYNMIKSFACRHTDKLFKDMVVRKFAAFARSARKKLDLLNATCNIQELTSPPGNNLESLIGNRKGQYSIRINRQWRICFRWYEGNAYDVEIVDYH